MPKAGFEPAITASERSKTVHASDSSATAIHTAEQLVPEHNPSEFEIAVEISKAIIGQLSRNPPAELLEAGYETIHSKFRKHINSVLNKNFCSSS
jgi:hypothetical protein